MRCGARDGTVVLAHYFGPRRHAYGGGLSLKGHDAIGAWLCMRCHALMDTFGREKLTRWEASEEMLHLCALTWLRLIEQGWIRIGKPDLDEVSDEITGEEGDE